MSVARENEGRPGERKVQSFFDGKIGNIITFPNAKTKSNAEIADLLVWLNWKALLVEVKSRVSSKITLDQWVHQRIAEAADQITNGVSVAKRYTFTTTITTLDLMTREYPTLRG
jgi:Holliday junction resolvase